MAQFYHFCAPTRAQNLELGENFLPEVTLSNAVMKASLTASDEYIPVAVMEFGFDIRKVDGVYTLNPR